MSALDTASLKQMILQYELVEESLSAWKSKDSLAA
jgi:hypothetical protein